uniref:Major facilitator superfamily (MFS) profile domain-containing protein n=1 Tax=Rhodosorus marinus TaxID=101924 RepID=A0A7S0BFI1_9RHOD|mmetsp:Transcript_14425/g.21040  ORF Transcript_14425/g.21040 Transcript_14425/m.21040 type:complete len:452 (+) Transcript_14425:141-1496(+)
MMETEDLPEATSLTSFAGESSYGSSVDVVEDFGHDEQKTQDKAQEMNVRKFAFVMALLFLVTFAISILIPVLPSLLLRIMDGSTSRAAYASGIISFATMPLELLLLPYVGALSDRVGRKPVLLFGIAGFAMEIALLATFRNLPMYVVSKYMSSVGNAFPTTANACVADLVVGTGNEPVFFGVLGVVGGASFALGPMVGGLIVSNFNEQTALWTSVGLFGLAAIGIWFMPETLKNPHERPINLNVINFTRLFKRDRYLTSLIATQFLINFTSVWHGIAYLYFYEKLTWGAADIGRFLSFAGVVAIFNQGLLTRFAIKAFGEYPTMKIGFLSELGYLLVMTFMTKSWHAYASLFVGSFGWIAIPTLRAIIARQVPTSEQGSLQGSLSAMNTLQTGFGSLLMSVVFGVFSTHDGPAPYMPNAPFAFPLLNMVTATICLFQSEKEKHTETEAIAK